MIPLAKSFSDQTVFRIQASYPSDSARHKRQREVIAMNSTLTRKGCSFAHLTALRAALGMQQDA